MEVCCKRRKNCNESEVLAIFTFLPLPCESDYISAFHFLFRSHQSFEVSNAIYGSMWYEGSIEVEKFIGFVLMRAQKSFVVYSGFYEANLNTFSSVSFI